MNCEELLEALNKAQKDFDKANTPYQKQAKLVNKAQKEATLICSMTSDFTFDCCQAQKHANALEDDSVYQTLLLNMQQAENELEMATAAAAPCLNVGSSEGNIDNEEGDSNYGYDDFSSGLGDEVEWDDLGWENDFEDQDNYEDQDDYEYDGNGYDDEVIDTSNVLSWNDQEEQPSFP